ncbi:DUF5313 domain-containing protein [Rhodococcus sp. ARC_M12]|uniref:DUF5313 family protein n=1 Tax=Rhodococcus navarretei TaxID=3128981 RepID=A0ABU9D3A3_9NOCA|nr:DUF5313 family protein [Rhodococcus sp. ARC_M12]MCJ0978906.1 DUF5313 domain-containing protein [Rhodococcus sp. ARC_M12]
MKTPTFRQRVRYDVGGVLPDDLQDWVLHDLTGRGSTPRYLARFLVPLVAVLLLFLLFPGPNWIAGLMMLLIFVPVVYFASALHLIYRAFRLGQHGIDAASIPRATPSAERDRKTYEANYRHP